MVDMLRSDPAYLPELSLVAVVDEQICAHLLFTRIDIEAGQERFPALALAPMAVLPEKQNQGIGSKLVQFGLEQARQLGFTAVIVLGWPEYYPRCGFRPASRWEIRAPFPVPDPVFMALELILGALKNVRGAVPYTQPFYII